MAVLARKITLYENSADWISMRLTHSRPLWLAPPRQASMICAWGPVTYRSFKKQRGEIFGWSWWGSGDTGGRQRWWGGLVRAGLSGVRQGRCGESAVQPLWKGSVCVCVWWGGWFWALSTHQNLHCPLGESQCVLLKKRVKQSNSEVKVHSGLERAE